MSNKSWKQAERRAAALVGSKRTPLSGGNGGVTRADTLHPKLFIEIKQKRRHTTYSLYRKTKELAKREKKVPMLVLDEVRAPGQLIVLHSNDLPAAIAALIASNKKIFTAAKKAVDETKSKR